MKLSLTFITPLWTADATKEAHHVEGTALVGSLRWWYEVLIRGLGGWACDPAGEEGRCGLDADAFKKRREQGCEHAGKGHLCPSCEAETLAKNGLCTACQFFGATGWRKSFSFIPGDAAAKGYPPAGRGRVQVDAGRKNLKGEPSAYFFPQGLTGPLTLDLLPRRRDDRETVALLLGLLEFIRRNAALGAKTNLGYGLFDWAESKPPKDLPSAEDFAKMMANRAAVQRQGAAGRWPNLQEMFFAEVNLRESWQPEGKDFVNFKYDLRAVFREGQAIQQQITDPEHREHLRHFLLGSTETDPHEASKVKMALLPDRRTLRLWGWVPKVLPGGAEREKVVQLLRQQAASQGRLARWREFDSPARDTTGGRFTDPVAFLRSLMDGGMR